MKIYFFFCCLISGIFVFPLAPAREPLPLVSTAEESVLKASAFFPDIPIQAPDDTVLQEQDMVIERCTVPANLSQLSPQAQAIFDTALQQVPCQFMQTLRTVEVVDDAAMPRALAGKFTLKIRTDVLTRPEFAEVLIHEFGHIIDLGGVQGSPSAGESEFRDGHLPIFKNDISLHFYRISWKNSEELRPEATTLDFVGGYAMENPFEDFAESMLLYRFHGNTFRALAQENVALAQKYEFFHTYIFSGEEFLTGKTTAIVSPNRPWDITRL